MMNKSITQPITQEVLIFEPHLFKGVTVLESAYFRAMLIFDTVHIIENLRKWKSLLREYGINATL